MRVFILQYNFEQLLKIKNSLSFYVFFVSKASLAKILFPIEMEKSNVDFRQFDNQSSVTIFFNSVINHIRFPFLQVLCKKTAAVFSTTVLLV